MEASVVVPSSGIGALDRSTHVNMTMNLLRLLLFPFIMGHTSLVEEVAVQLSIPTIKGRATRLLQTFRLTKVEYKYFMKFSDENEVAHASRVCVTPLANHLRARTGIIGRLYAR